MIRLIAVVSGSPSRKSARIEEGSKIEGNYRGKGKWYTGKVTRDRGDGTFDVAYDDGESETRVEEMMLRLLGGSSSSSSSRFLDDEVSTEKLLVGARVEAKYKGKEKLYIGSISRARLNGTYDINYDDGESEIGVARGLIFPLASSGTNCSPSRSSARIEEGSKVEGNYRQKGKWYTGKVTRDRRDGTFDIDYDDGESETRVDEALIRLIGGSSSLSGSRDIVVELVEGTSVEAFYKGKKWYPGKISRVRLNGTFDINYDDGEKEIGMTRANVRAVASRGLSPRADRERNATSSLSSRIEEGSKVEGNYRGKGKWYTGKVTRDRKDGTFDVAYDDGESETRVEEALLRLLGGGSGSPSKRSAKIEEGSKVEGNFRGKGRWYKGKVTRDRRDGTFDIDYDDGESETRVDETMIKLLGGGGDDLTPKRDLSSSMGNYSPRNNRVASPPIRTGSRYSQEMSTRASTLASPTRKSPSFGDID